MQAQPLGSLDERWTGKLLYPRIDQLWLDAADQAGCPARIELFLVTVEYDQDAEIGASVSVTEFIDSRHDQNGVEHKLLLETIFKDLPDDGFCSPH